MVRVRFAPSPTGPMHVGNCRTAIFNFLWAKHCGGQFLMRIEDTDLERSTKENVAFLFEALDWLGIRSDETPVFQSANEPRHRVLLTQLLNEDKAYFSESSKDDVLAYKESNGSHLGFRGEASDKGAIRLRVPNEGDTVVTDVIRGSLSFPNRSLDDPVIARADGSPLYNFAVAVDDADMAITHVIRGEDHLSNTARQVLVIEALGLPLPIYAHLPLINGTDNKKLAKRHGSISVQDFMRSGYLPEALINYLALLGWGSGEHTLLSLDEMIAKFDLKDVTHHPAQFDERKLRWLNGLWVRHLEPEDLTKRVSNYIGRNVPSAAVTASQEKFATLDEFWPLVEGIYEGPLPLDKKAEKVMGHPQIVLILKSLRDALESVTTWDAEHIHLALDPLPSSLDIGAGKVFQPLRVALTGRTVSPGIGETVALLTKDEALRRLDASISFAERL